MPSPVGHLTAGNGSLVLMDCTSSLGNVAVRGTLGGWAQGSVGACLMGIWGVGLRRNQAHPWLVLCDTHRSAGAASVLLGFHVAALTFPCCFLAHPLVMEVCGGWDLAELVKNRRNMLI